MNFAKTATMLFSSSIFSLSYGFYDTALSQGRSLQDCVRAWQNSLPGISTDKALEQCQTVGFPSSSRENRGDCVAKSFESFKQAWHPQTATKKAQEFCSQGGNSTCLGQSYQVYTQAWHPQTATQKAQEFCLKGGTGSCLTQSYQAFKQAWHPQTATQKAAESCLG